jgi:hypothetical protein
VSLATPLKLRRLQETLYTKAKQEPADRFYLLYDKVYRADILAHAYALAKQNGGAPGVDGVTFEDIEAAGLEPWLAAVQEVSVIRLSEGAPPVPGSRSAMVERLAPQGSAPSTRPSCASNRSLRRRSRPRCPP